MKTLNEILENIKNDFAEKRKLDTSFKEKFYNQIVDVLTILGATSSETKLKIDDDYRTWVEVSIFDDDSTSAQITSLYVHNGIIYGDMYGYYYGEEMYDVNISRVVYSNDFQNIASDLEFYLTSDVYKKKQ